VSEMWIYLMTEIKTRILGPWVPLYIVERAQKTQEHDVCTVSPH
jgi:hypothetical protein